MTLAYGWPPCSTDSLKVTHRDQGRPVLLLHGPTTVYQQIMDFYRKVGGFGHLVMIGRSGFMTHAEAEKGSARFARDVLPRLKEIAPVTPP